MRYSESREQSAELLRMLLPHMARHAAGFHPMSYAVWYEHLAGTNPALSAALEARLARVETLADGDIIELYERHVVGRDTEASVQMTGEIARLVEQVDGAASEASNKVRRYADELDGYRQQLQTDLGRDALGKVVASLIVETGRVRDSTDTFTGRLRLSSQEVERLRAELEVAQGLACRDPLTGLLNRRGLDQQRQRDCGADYDACSLMLIDIDRFKAINDAHGHLLGDKVISAVARALQTNVGERGPIARLGGEEFAALLLRAPGEQAMGIAELVRAAVERGRLRRAEGESIGGVTVSIGVATAYPGESFESLMLRADRALYRSKAAGRNTVTLASREETGER